MKSSYKAVFFSVTVLLTPLIGSSPVRAEGVSIVDGVPTVSVQGSGRLNTVPDEASVSFGVTSEDAVLKKAYERQTQSMNKLIAAVKAAGIKPEDIRTQSYQINPVYPDSREPYTTRLKPTGYRVSHELVVKIRDLAKMTTVIDAAAASEGAFFNWIQFSTSRQKELEKEARLKAVEDARDNASRIAGALGNKLGRVLRISDASAGYYPAPKMMARAEAGFAAGPAIESGSMEISADISVVFEILPQ